MHASDGTRPWAIRRNLCTESSALTATRERALRVRRERVAVPPHFDGRFRSGRACGSEAVEARAHATACGRSPGANRASHARPATRAAPHPRVPARTFCLTSSFARRDVVLGRDSDMQLSPVASTGVGEGPCGGREHAIRGERAVRRLQSPSMGF